MQQKNRDLNKDCENCKRPSVASMGLGTPILILLAPKCPLCLASWTWLAAAAGIPEGPYLLIVEALVSLACFSLTFQLAKRRFFVTGALVLIGWALLVAERHWDLPPMVRLAGLSLFLIGTLRLMIAGKGASERAKAQPAV